MPCLFKRGVTRLTKLGSQPISREMQGTYSSKLPKCMQDILHCGWVIVSKLDDITAIKELNNLIRHVLDDFQAYMPYVWETIRSVADKMNIHVWHLICNSNAMRDNVLALLREHSALLTMLVSQWFVDKDMTETCCFRITELIPVVSGVLRCRSLGCDFVYQ